MNEIQSALYALLKDFNDLCKKAEVPYYLAGGTALGTVRNHAFLPWDDDVDVYITGNNWNKLRTFIETHPEAIPEGRDLVYNENTPYHYNPIPRFVNTNTTSIKSAWLIAGKALGQFIDVLIMDPMPADPVLAEHHLDLLKAYTEVSTPYFIVNKSLNLEEYIKHYSICETYYNRIHAEGRDKVVKEMEDELLQHIEEESDELVMRWGVQILKYKKNDFGVPRLEKFEDDYFPVAEHAENILRRAYGDSWMYIPVMDEQVLHTMNVDLNVPFKKYTDIIMPYVDKEACLEAYNKNKEVNVSAHIEAYKVNALTAKIRANISNKEFKKSFHGTADEASEMLARDDYTGLNEFFAYYYSLQLDGEFRKHNCLIDMDDDLLYYALLNKIRQGEYWTANKLLNVIKVAGRHSEHFEYAEKLIELCRMLSIAVYDEKDAEKASKILSDMNEEELRILDAYRTKLWLLRQKEAWQEIQKIAAEARKIFDFDGELMAYSALAAYYLGDTENAHTLYSEAVLKTRNAFVWEDAKNLVGIEQLKNAVQKEVDA